MNYYKRHLGDIAKSCGDLSQGEMGAYDLLMDWLYANEKPISNTPEKYYRIARAATKAERSNVDSVLRDLFDLTDAGYIQKRVMEEIEHFGEVSDSARKSANARWGKSHNGDDAKRMRNASGTQSVRNASHYSITPIAKEQDQKKGRASAPACPSDVPETTWVDWLALRKAKRAPVSATVVERARAESVKAGMPFADFLAEWCERGSQGLKAEWINPGRARGSPPVAQQFAAKTYTGTPDDELPSYLKP